MPMDAFRYHGSPTQGLKEIHPDKSTHLVMGSGDKRHAFFAFDPDYAATYGLQLAGKGHASGHRYKNGKYEGKYLKISPEQVAMLDKPMSLYKVHGEPRPGHYLEYDSPDGVLSNELAVPYAVPVAEEQKFKTVRDALKQFGYNIEVQGPSPARQTPQEKLAMFKAMADELSQIELEETAKTAAKLTYQARENLSGGSFVFPKERRYPIHDEAHARNALARSSGKPEEAKVRAAVHAKYPGIGKTAAVDDPEEKKRAARRSTGAAMGGQIGFGLGAGATYRAAQKHLDKAQERINQLNHRARGLGFASMRPHSLEKQEQMVRMGERLKRLATRADETGVRNIKRTALKGALATVPLTVAGAYGGYKLVKHFQDKKGKKKAAAAEEKKEPSNWRGTAAGAALGTAATAGGVRHLLGRNLDKHLSASEKIQLQLSRRLNKIDAARPRGHRWRANEAQGKAFGFADKKNSALREATHKADRRVLIGGALALPVVMAGGALAGRAIQKKLRARQEANSKTAAAAVKKATIVKYAKEAPEKDEWAQPNLNWAQRHKKAIGAGLALATAAGVGYKLRKPIGNAIRRSELYNKLRHPEEFKKSFKIVPGGTLTSPARPTAEEKLVHSITANRDFGEHSGTLHETYRRPRSERLALPPPTGAPTHGRDARPKQPTVHLVVPAQKPPKVRRVKGQRRRVTNVDVPEGLLSAKVTPPKNMTRAERRAMKFKHDKPNFED